MNIIRSAVPFGEDRHKLHEPQFEVIFSIPKDARSNARDVDRWYLASIKPLEAKKEPPQEAEPGYGRGGGVGPLIAGPQSRAVQLVGVRFSDGSPRDLLAKFAEFVPQGGFSRRQEVGKIELGMGGPIGSTRNQAIADVTHALTIRNIIKSSVSSPPRPNARIDETHGASRCSRYFSRFLRTLTETLLTSHGGSCYRSTCPRRVRSSRSQRISKNPACRQNRPGVDSTEGELRP